MTGRNKYDLCLICGTRAPHHEPGCPEDRERQARRPAGAPDGLADWLKANQAHAARLAVQRKARPH